VKDGYQCRQLSNAAGKRLSCKQRRMATASKRFFAVKRPSQSVGLEVWLNCGREGFEARIG
jgi:hypothetical protein